MEEAKQVLSSHLLAFHTSAVASFLQAHCAALAGSSQWRSWIADNAPEAVPSAVASVLATPQVRLHLAQSCQQLQCSWSVAAAIASVGSPSQGTQAACSTQMQAELCTAF